MLHVNDARTRERQRGAKTDEKQIAVCVQFVFFFFFSSFRRAPILGFLPIPGFSDFQCFPRAFQRVMWVTDRGGMLADTTSC